jgi:formylglycine-generating enzyme required for sulfatase activity
VTRRAPLPALVAAAATLAAGSHSRSTSAAPARGDAIVNSLGMRMVLVPGGTFRMGSPAGEPLRQEEEVPRRVSLTRAFRIASTEVTLRQWLALMPSDAGSPHGGELPATSLSWREAREFCAKLSQKEGATYRLPTEAEWEYACRAGATEGPAERGAIEATAWYADNSDGTTHPVGQKGPNAWHLFDMLGNVAEWTSDAYGPYPRAEEDKDPVGPPTGTTKVVRGGSWRAFLPALRCAARTGAPESYQLPHVGLRVVLEVG